MKSRTALMLAGTAALLALAAAPVGARPAPTPVVDVQPFAAIAPDGRSAAVQVIASCPERWTLLEAVVSVAQPQASGQTSFPLTCAGFLQVFNVTVPVSAGVFDLGLVDVAASVVVKRGKTASAQDADTIQPTPIVAVDIAGTARLVEGGATIDVTIACSGETTGIESRFVISRGLVVDVGTYTPLCDGTPHTHAVFVPTTLGPGPAQVLTFAQVEFAGQVFYGIDDGTIEIVS